MTDRSATLILSQHMSLYKRAFNKGWSKKTAQSLWHHNFATIHHRVMRFSAKCSERKSVHD